MRLFWEIGIPLCNESPVRVRGRERKRGSTGREPSGDLVRYTMPRRAEFRGRDVWCVVGCCSSSGTKVVWFMGRRVGDGSVFGSKYIWV